MGKAAPTTPGRDVIMTYPVPVRAPDDDASSARPLLNKRFIPRPGGQTQCNGGHGAPASAGHEFRRR